MHCEAMHEMWLREIVAGLLMILVVAVAKIQIFPSIKFQKFVVKLPSGSVNRSLSLLVHRQSSVFPLNFDLDFVAVNFELLIDLLQELHIFRR